MIGGNKGGVVAIVEGLRGFVPFSQISTVDSSPWSAFIISCLILAISNFHIFPSPEPTCNCGGVPT